MEMKIGFIGLGIMGSRMAANLQKHGYPLVLFNRTRSKAEKPVGERCGVGRLAGSSGRAGGNAVHHVRSSGSGKEAALGQDGFLTHLPPDALWVDCSTVNPSIDRDP